MRHEKDVKREVKKLLDLWGWFYFMPPANAYGKSGIADILAIKNGVFLSVETKFGTNKPSALQVGFLNSIRSEMGFAFVVSDRTIHWFERWLQCFDNATQAVAAAGGVNPDKAVAQGDGADLLNAIAVLTELL